LLTVAEAHLPLRNLNDRPTKVKDFLSFSCETHPEGQSDLVLSDPGCYIVGDMQKNYILDANILIHDPQSIFQFADNTVIIPVAVITEIDRFKKEMTDRGYNARAVVRLLDGLREGYSLAEGVPLAQGGQLRVYCEPDKILTNGTLAPGGADGEILRVASKIHAAEPDIPVIIVTKDINLRIRADAAGLRAEDYETDRVKLSEVYLNQAERALEADQMQRLHEEGSLSPIPGEPLSPNEYVLLRGSNGSKQSILGRANPDADGLRVIREAEKGLLGVKPRNKEQYFAVDALLDDEIQLATLMGKAGTGKTLLAIAGALHTTLRRKNFRKVLIARPVVPMGRDLGYLPGDVDKKLEPWMKPITDTIQFLLHNGATIRGMTDLSAMMRQGLIELQPLTYIRGRNITNAFVVIDEAQNLTPLEVKTVITRIGNDAKIVLTGDPYQIDNPYVDANSNGFTYVVNRFRSQAIAAHVQLVKGERSELAELAANLL
jgi:PhoH-like ATPase